MRKLIVIGLGLLGITLGGAVVAQTIGSVSHGYIEEGNLVRSGNIIQTIVLPEGSHARNADTCRKACDADDTCYAYTYRQVRAQFKPECHLRLAALPNNARRNHGFDHAVSGTKVSYADEVFKMSLTPGQGIMGGTTLRRFDVANGDPIACLDACWRNGLCKGATYFPKGFGKQAAPSCIMYGQTAKLTNGAPQPGVLTGIKVNPQLPTLNKPVPRPGGRVNPTRPILKRPSGQPTIIPDQDNNPALSDDIDADEPA